MAKDNPYGDDAGTRVGRPDTPTRDNTHDAMSAKDNQDGSAGSTTGSGNEAARGIHQAGAQKPGGKSGKSGQPGNTGKTGDSAESGAGSSRPGSEPLEERDSDHTSGYGGEGGAPRTSSDQR